MASHEFLKFFSRDFNIMILNGFTFKVSAPGWLLLRVAPAEVGVFTWAEVFEVVPVGPHLHPGDDYYVDVHGDEGRGDD